MHNLGGLSLSLLCSRWGAGSSAKLYCWGDRGRLSVVCICSDWDFGWQSWWRIPWLWPTVCLYQKKKKLVNYVISYSRNLTIPCSFFWMVFLSLSHSLGCRRCHHKWVLHIRFHAEWSDGLVNAMEVSGSLINHVWFGGWEVMSYGKEHVFQLVNTDLCQLRSWMHEPVWDTSSEKEFSIVIVVHKFVRMWW